MQKGRTGLSIKSAIDAVRNSPFIKHNAVFFAGSLVVSFLNYLFYPVLSRSLQPAEFGEVQALLAISLQIAIFFSILMTVTVFVTVNTPDPAERNKILLGLERIAMIAGVVFVGFGLLNVNNFKSFLNFSHGWPFVIILLIVVINIPLTFRMAFLRGKKEYAKSIFSDGIGSFAKLLIAPVLILVGWRTLGAITALALSQVVSLGFAWVWAHRAGFSGFGLRGQHAKFRNLYPQLKHALALFVATFSIMAIFSADVLSIKHYFEPLTAGQYAGMTTVARIIFFLTAPFVAVMVTLVSIRQKPRKNAMQLKGTLALITGIGGFALIAMSISPSLPINILVGGKYLAYSNLLPKLGLAMLVLSLSNALVMYHVALKRYWVIITPVIGLMVTLSLLYLNHEAVGNIINDVLIGSVGVLIAAGTYQLIRLVKGAGANTHG